MTQDSQHQAHQANRAALRAWGIEFDETAICHTYSVRDVHPVPKRKTSQTCLLILVMEVRAHRAKRRRRGSVTEMERTG